MVVWRSLTLSCWLQNWDCFEATVGVNDPSAEEEKSGAGEESDTKSADEARTVLFEVVGDGKVLSSLTLPVPSRHTLPIPGAKLFAKIEGLKRLELRVTCIGASTGLFPVWLDAKVRNAPWVFDKLEVPS